MKRFWHRFLTLAVLGCLLAVWAVPASAYYPPLQAMVYQSGTYGVEYKVYDPKLQKNVVYGNKYYENTFVELKQQNGVMAWVANFPMFGGKFVFYCVYDPFQAGFAEEADGPFTDVSQLTVQDGVVAYVAGTPPSDMGPGYQVIQYATYDPRKGWQKRTRKPDGAGMAGFTVYDVHVTTKNGIVLWYYKYDPPLAGIHASDVGADIYDATLWLETPSGLWGHWISEQVGYHISLYGGQNQFVWTQAEIINFEIQITHGIEQTDIWVKETWGYDHSKKDWYNGPTKPIAAFVAQPTSGPNPLWVSFTDLSIGGASVDWSFGDGATSTKRSEYYKYTKNGAWLAEQKIKGTGTSSTNEAIYVGVKPPEWIAAYADMVTPEELTMLRQYRDEVLTRSDQGKTLKNQLYKHSTAALKVLLNNLELLVEAGNLIHDNKGALIQVLQGHEGIIYDPEAVLAFLQSFGEKAPPKLRALINVVKKEMRQSQQEGKPFLGFRLGVKDREAHGN